MTAPIPSSSSNSGKRASTEASPTPAKRNSCEEKNDPCKTITKIISLQEMWIHLRQSLPIPDSSDLYGSKTGVDATGPSIQFWFSPDDVVIKLPPYVHLISEIFFKQVEEGTLRENQKLLEAGAKDQRRDRSWFHGLHNLLKKLHMMDYKWEACDPEIREIALEMHTLGYKIHALSSRDQQGATTGSILKHLKDAGLNGIFNASEGPIVHRGERGLYHKFKEGEETNKGAQLVSFTPPAENPGEKTHIVFVDTSKEDCEAVLDYINGNEKKGISPREDLVSHVYCVDKPFNPNMPEREKRAAVIGLYEALEWIPVYKQVLDHHRVRGKDPATITAEDLLQNSVEYVEGVTNNKKDRLSDPELRDAARNLATYFGVPKGFFFAQELWHKPVLRDYRCSKDEEYREAVEELGINISGNNRDFMKTLLQALENFSESLGIPVKRASEIEPEEEKKSQ